MSYALIFTESDNRRATRFIKKHPELRTQSLKTLQLFEANPHHPSLRPHRRSGKQQDLHSVAVNLSYRITRELLIQDQHIISFNNVGGHGGVY